jgi:hypothetical protein
VRAAFWLPLPALFNARVRLNWRGSLWPMSRQEPETQTPLLFVTKRTSSHCLKSRLHMVHMKIRNASVERSLFTGTLIRLMRYEAEKESSCVALD